VILFTDFFWCSLLALLEDEELPELWLWSRLLAILWDMLNSPASLTDAFATSSGDTLIFPLQCHNGRIKARKTAQKYP
jgi:hypothetical protein